jgi:hypothetical protein
VILWQEQEQRPGRQGLRAGAEFRLRSVLQEQEKLSGRQGSDLSFYYLMRVVFDPGLKEEHKRPAHPQMLMVMRSLILRRAARVMASTCRTKLMPQNLGVDIRPRH